MLVSFVVSYSLKGNVINPEYNRKDFNLQFLVMPEGKYQKRYFQKVDISKTCS